METPEQTASRTQSILQTWTDTVVQRILTEPGFSERLQARWLELVASEMKNTPLTVEDQLNEDILQRLYLVAVIECCADDVGADDD